jgi:hypothetical protein
MYQPRAKITFSRSDGATQVFTVFNDFNVFKSYEQLTNKCTVTFPKKYQSEYQDYFAGTDPIFKRGDKIVIECGYYPNLEKVFEGYIRDVNANIPVTVICEDSMYLLKKYTFNVPAEVPLITTTKKGKFLKRPKINTALVKKLQLKELLNIIIPDDIELDTDIIDIDLGKVIFSRMTAAEILGKLKDTHGLFSYFIDTKLYVGFQSNALTTKEAEFVMERAVINSNNLFYKRAEDVPIKVVCISMDNNNVKTTEEAGEEDGEVRTYHYYNVSQEALKQYAQERLNEERYTGFHGDMVTFLEPMLSHGDRARIVSSKIPERNGTYLVKSVSIDIGVTSGAKQVLELGQKVA